MNKEKHETDHRHFPRRPGSVAGMLAAILIGLAVSGPSSAASATSSGTLADGTPYRIDVPEKWNGVVLIGLDYAGRDPNAEGDAGATSRALLARGYAMAGTTRTITGWAIHRAAANAIQTLDIFEAKHGKPKHAVAFGASQGGHAAAVGVQAYPARWHGAVVQCGSTAGTVALWQGKFDGLFVARTLLAPGSGLPVIQIPKDFKTSVLPAWRAMFQAAQQTPQGRARIALAAVIAQLPEWPDSTIPPPNAGDLAARQHGLYASITGPGRVLDQAMSSRLQIETLSGGNITSNVGVDYAQLLREADRDSLVSSLYQAAGLDLKADLETLVRAPRVAADPKALAYVASGIFDGNLAVPVLTQSGIGDPISPVSAQQSYEETVKARGRESMLRQVYTASAGHCGFTPSESVAVVETLVRRLDTGSWGGTNADAMNRVAAETGLGKSRFIDYAPARFLRPYGICDLRRDLDAAKVTAMATPGQTLPACLTK